MEIFTISKILQKIKGRYLNHYFWMVFLLGIFLIASLWIFLQYHIQFDYERTIEENSQDTMNVAKAFEEHVRKVIMDADAKLIRLRRSYEKNDIFYLNFEDYVEQLAKDPTQTIIGIYDDRGNVIQSSDPNMIKVNRLDREYYQFHKNHDTNELYIGLPIIGRANGKGTIPLTRRINKADGTFGGIVYIGLSTDYFISYYKKIDLGHQQLLSLSGLDGVNRICQTDDSFEMGRDIKEGDFWNFIQSGYVNTTYMAKSPIDGITRIISYRIMPEYPLIITVGKSQEVALANFTKRKQGYLFGAIFTSVFIIAFCILLVKQYSKQQRMNGALSRLERLNLVGEMAAGIGHEIRNPLTTVRGYLQWYLNHEKYVELKNSFSTMIEELDRANAIITEYLSLAKDKTIKLKLGNLNSTLDALFPLLQAEAYNSGHTLRIEKNEIPNLYIDKNELRQLILNMVHNGFDAMEPNGILTIRSYAEKNQVILEIGDTGKGIPSSILEKIGTPFLTTKDQGTGLGLAVCYQIAARHKAKIDVETSSNGTIFYIRFTL